MTLLHRNPNRRAARERWAALRAEASGPAAGAVVRVLREDGRVDLVRVTDAYTTATGIPMLTVRHTPHGIQSFAVRADAVVPESEPDVRHDGVDCGGTCEQHQVEARAARRDIEWEAGL